MNRCVSEILLFFVYVSSLLRTISITTQLWVSEKCYTVCRIILEIDCHKFNLLDADSWMKIWITQSHLKKRLWKKTIFYIFYLYLLSDTNICVAKNIHWNLKYERCGLIWHALTLRKRKVKSDSFFTYFHRLCMEMFQIVQIRGEGEVGRYSQEFLSSPRRNQLGKCTRRLFDK